MFLRVLSTYLLTYLHPAELEAASRQGHRLRHSALPLPRSWRDRRQPADHVDTRQICVSDVGRRKNNEIVHFVLFDWTTVTRSSAFLSVSLPRKWMQLIRPIHRLHTLHTIICLRKLAILKHTYTKHLNK